MLRKGLGLDIGTTQISIFESEGGLLLKEPNVAAVEADTDKVLEAGHAALQMAKEDPDHIRLCWPVWDPVVKCADILAGILRIFFRRALGRKLLRPQVMVSIPCDLTEAQTNAVEDAVLAAGASRVHLLEAPLCAALGAGFDFSVPTGQMLVHIGASRTEAAVIFLGDMVTHITTHIGGNQFDTAIMQYMRNRYQLYIGRRTAEQIKKRIAMIAGNQAPRTLDVKGRCMKTQELRLVTLNSREMLGALKEPLANMLDTLLSVVEQTAEEMRADIGKGGIVLTGGGVLQGMDQFFADVMGLRTRIVTNSETAAVEGAAKALARIR